jgi:cohesin loading factor subunit SCC2
VKQAIIDRFQDEATSVRQATVDLVGKYVLQRPSLFETYYQALVERSVDKGVSVRKTVVKIFGEFLNQNPATGARTEICRRLVERASMVKEEDTVKDLIRDTFQSMWFSEHSKTSASVEVAVDDEERDASAAENGMHHMNGGAGRKAGKLSDAARLEAVALQMVEVIAGLQNTEWLVGLLNHMLFGPGEGEQGKRDRAKERKTIEKRCRAIVKCLIEILLKLDEGAQPALDRAIPELATPAKQLLAVISTLFVFSRANPAFLLDHVGTLLPYLKAENHVDKQDEASICYMVSHMVGLVIPLERKPDHRAIQDVVRDLVQITYKFTPTTIHAAIQCLSNICTYVNKDPAPLLKLANTFYKVLRQYIRTPDLSKESSQARSAVHRALIVLGCICRYYSFKSTSEDPALLTAGTSADKKKLKDVATLDAELTAKSIYEVSYRVIAAYLHKDLETEIKAIQAICSLFTGYMKLMLVAQRDGLVEKMLQSRHNAVKLTALKSLRDVLLAEEERVESGAARENMASAGISLKQRVKGDQDAEASIVGGVVQEHLETIKALLMSSDVQLRQASIALLGVLHRQGLVNPLQTLPALVALLGDTCSGVRADAFRQLLIEHEKHPEFLQSRVLDGICLCYHFQNTALQDASVIINEDREMTGAAGGGGTGLTTQCIFGPLYGSCVRGNRKHRNGFLRGLLSLFEEKTAKDVRAASGAGGAKEGPHRRRSSVGAPTFTGSSSQQGSLDPPFLAFIARVLAFLPFDVQEEPLLLISHISRMVSLEGSALLHELKDIFRKAGIRIPEAEGENEGDSDMDDEDIRPPAPAPRDDDEDAPVPMEMDVGVNGAVSPKLLALLKDKCAAGMAFCLLLRLKFFLKNVYSLSDERCKDYVPKEGTAKGERPLNRPDFFPAFELPEHLIVPLDDGSEVLPKLLAQFSEFRRLIRCDPADFALHKPTKAPRRRSSAGSTASKKAPQARRSSVGSNGSNGTAKKGGGGRKSKGSATPAASGNGKRRRVSFTRVVHGEESSTSEGEDVGMSSSSDDSDDSM